jgi:hypothetical protein
MKISNVIINRKNRIFQVLLIMGVFFLCHQNSFAQKDVNFALGLAIGYTPNLKYDSYNDRLREGKGNNFSLLAEVHINNQWVGRFQFVNLITSTYKGDLEETIKSSRTFTGSIGYIFGNSDSKLRLSVMGSAGAGLISYGQFTDGGVQVGITTGPQYQLTENVFAIAEIRYLKGFAYDETSGNISQTDALIGVKMMF